MRAVLVFPPRASATYVPLGIATLAPYIEAQVPKAQVRLVDLNIALWIRCAAAVPNGQALMDFVRGKAGNFFDPSQTLLHKAVWDQVRQKMTVLAGQAEAYVAKEEADLEFTALLGAMTEQVLSFDPELVGISVLFPEQVPFAAALARAVKKAVGPEKRIRLVMGGAMMSALWVEDLLQAVPEIDGIVQGEGEAAMAALCRGAALSQVPGLVYTEGGRMTATPNSATLSLKALPAPDFARLPLEAYFNPEPVLPVLFSRGCAWRKCRFCSHNFSFGGFRRKSPEAFVRELEGYSSALGVRHFYSADEFIQPQDMDAICQVLMERGLRVFLHILGKPTPDYTPERLAFWAAAGCRWIGWGIETGSQRLLDLINKGTRAEEIHRVLEGSAQAGISNLGLMIFGLPTSTDQDQDLTFEFLARAGDSLDALTSSAFVLFGKTHFARNAAKYGLHIDGCQTLFAQGRAPVRTRRLKFREIASDGSLRSPRGALEVAAWQRYRRWLGEPGLLEQLPGEHYLIHVSGQRNLTGQFSKILSR